MNARTGEQGRRFQAAEWLYIGGAVALAFYLRLLAVGLRKGYLGFDESMFIVLGKNLISGRGYQLNGLPNATFPFALPLIAGAFRHVTGSVRWALSLPTALFGAFTAIPVYLIMRDIRDRLAAVTASVLYAGFPALLFLVPFCDYGQRLYAGSEAIFLFFIMSAACAAVRSMRAPSAAAGLTLGLFAGTAFEVRQDALGYLVPLVVAVYAYAAVRNRRIFHAEAAKSVAVAAVTFAVLAAPFVLWVKHVTGEYSLGPRFAKTFRMRDSLEKVVRNNLWGDALKDYFAPNGADTEIKAAYYGVSDWHRAHFAEGDYTVRAAEVLSGARASNLPVAWRLLWRRLMPEASWVLVLVGLVSAVIAGRWRLIVLLAALLVPNAFVAMELYVIARFYTVFAVALVLPGAWGVDLCARGLVRLLPAAVVRPRIAAFVYLAVPLGIAILLANGAIESGRAASHDYDNFERRLLMQMDEFLPEMKRVVPAGSRLVAFSPIFEAREPIVWLAIPETTPRRIADYARNRAADFLLVRETDGYWMKYKPADAIAAAGRERVVIDRLLSGERWVLLDMRGPGGAGGGLAKGRMTPTIASGSSEGD